LLYLAEKNGNGTGLVSTFNRKHKMMVWKTVVPWERGEPGASTSFWKPICSGPFARDRDLFPTTDAGGDLAHFLAWQEKSRSPRTCIAGFEVEEEQPWPTQASPRKWLSASPPRYLRRSERLLLRLRSPGRRAPICMSGPRHAVFCPVPPTMPLFIAAR